jgi:dihydrofolate reductase
MAGMVLVAAYDRQRAIGRGNALPWHLPDDLARFKALTLDGTVLMGRHTAESIGRALPRRRNLVLTRAAQAPCEGQERVASLAEAQARVEPGAPLFVIGGGELYALALPQAQALELTLVETVVQGADAWFPAWDAADWEVTARQPHAADARHAFAFEFVSLRRRGAPGVA